MSTPSADVQFTVAAQSAAAQMTMFANQMKRQLKELRAEASKVNKPEGGKGAGDNMFASWSTDINKAVTALGGFAFAATAARSAVALVRQELDDILNRAEAANRRQVPFEAEMLGLAKSIPAGENAEEVTRRVMDMVKSSQTPDKAALVRMAKGAASAVSDMPYEDRIKLAVQVGEQNPDLMATDPSALNALGQQVVLGVHTFGKDGATAEAQQQMFYKGLTSARVSDPRLYAENVMGQVPKLNTDFGLNQFQGVALMNALTTGTQDPTGDLAATAAYSVVGAVSKARHRFGADIPEDFDKALEFIQDPTNPKSKEIRDYVLGAYSEEFQLTEEERAMLSEAQLNKTLASNLPGSRLKTSYSAMGLFQAKGTAEEPMGMKNLYKVAKDELGVQYMPDGSINTNATYAFMTKDWKDQQKRLAEDPLFARFNLDAAINVATENTRIADSTSELNQLMEKGQELLMTTGGAGVMQRGLWHLGDMLVNSSDPKETRKRLKDRLIQGTKNISFHGPRAMHDEETGRHWMASGVTNRNIDKIIEDRTISNAEAKQFGFTNDERASMQAMLDVVRKLEAIMNSTLRVEVVNQPDVNVKNQPKAQPRQPAAAQLNSQ